jgi:hypothetical protein
MLRKAPPAADPTGPGGSKCTEAELHGAMRSRPWAQSGPIAVRGPLELHVDTCTSRHRQPQDQQGTVAEEMLNYASTHAHLGTAGRGTRRGQLAASGLDSLEELRDLEWSNGCRRDTVTVCFQSSPQVTVDDS